MQQLHRTPPVLAGKAVDAGGQKIFARGSYGAIHVLAHRLSDEGRFEEAREALGHWLEKREGSGSDWVHLQFHLALCELETGRWDCAYRRFRRHILLSAATSASALTDGPALLWWLSLTAPKPVGLPWLPLRRIARNQLDQTTDPFTQVHNLLALGGAGDTDTLRAWSHKTTPAVSGKADSLLRQIGDAILAFADKTYGRAATILNGAIHDIDRFGGSRMQNRLFRKIRDVSLIRAAKPADQDFFASIHLSILSSSTNSGSAPVVSTWL